VVDRRAEAAAVSAMASGSQHNTMSAISHRIGRSLSVSAPTSSATYRIGAASVSIRRPCAATEARSALRVARLDSLPRSCAHPRGSHGLALGFYGRQGGVGPAALGRFFDHLVDLVQTPVEIGDFAGRHLDPGPERGVLRLDAGSRGAALPDMGGDRLSVEARDTDDRKPGNCRPAPPCKPPSGHALSALHHTCHADR